MRSGYSETGDNSGKRSEDAKCSSAERKVNFAFLLSSNLVYREGVGYKVCSMVSLSTWRDIQKHITAEPSDMCDVLRSGTQ